MKKIIKYLVITAAIFLNNGANAEMTTNTKIIIETTSGDIKIELYDDKAPITSENFIERFCNRLHIDESHIVNIKKIETDSRSTSII